MLAASSAGAAWAGSTLRTVRSDLVAAPLLLASTGDGAMLFGSGCRSWPWVVGRTVRRGFLYSGRGRCWRAASAVDAAAGVERLASMRLLHRLAGREPQEADEQVDRRGDPHDRERRSPRRAARRRSPRNDRRRHGARRRLRVADHDAADRHAHGAGRSAVGRAAGRGDRVGPHAHSRLRQEPRRHRRACSTARTCCRNWPRATPSRGRRCEIWSQAALRPGNEGGRTTCCRCSSSCGRTSPSCSTSMAASRGW